MSGAISDRADPKRIQRIHGERGTDGGPIVSRPAPTCDRTDCSVRAKRYLLFRWGAAVVCMKHFREDAATPTEKP